MDAKKPAEMVMAVKGISEPRVTAAGKAHVDSEGLST
jgi:hypothetical protein